MADLPPARDEYWPFLAFETMQSVNALLILLAGACAIAGRAGGDKGTPLATVAIPKTAIKRIATSPLGNASKHEA